MVITEGWGNQAGTCICRSLAIASKLTSGVRISPVRSLFSRTGKLPASG